VAEIKRGRFTKLASKSDAYITEVPVMTPSWCGNWPRCRAPCVTWSVIMMVTWWWSEIDERLMAVTGDDLFEVLYTSRRTFQLPTCITSRCALHAWNAIIERRRTAINVSEIADHNYHHHHQATPSSLVTSSPPPYSLTSTWNEH